jgi:hypothetical protein
MRRPWWRRGARADQEIESSSARALLLQQRSSHLIDEQTHYTPLSYHQLLQNNVIQMHIRRFRNHMWFLTTKALIKRDFYIGNSNSKPMERHPCMPLLFYSGSLERGGHNLSESLLVRGDRREKTGKRGRRWLLHFV